MYKQVLDPVSHSLGLTSIFALVPLVVLFVLLGVRPPQGPVGGADHARRRDPRRPDRLQHAGRPGRRTPALEGAAFGFWPIMWIVITALWIFNMTDATGYFAVLRRAFARVSDDLRVQVVMIAFCFGALLEALAGFGTPVAICGIMLVGLGVKPIKAAAVALVADTAPWPSARSRSRSPRSARSRGCPSTSSARWSAARRRFWRCWSRSCWCS